MAQRMTHFSRREKRWLHLHSPDHRRKWTTHFAIGCRVMCQLQPMLMWISTFIKHNIQYLCHCVSSSMASRYRMKYVVNTHEKGSRPAISKYLPGKIKWIPTAISSSVSLIPRLLLLLILSSGQKELIIIIFLFMLWHLYSLSSLGYSHFIYTTYRYILLYLRICGAAIAQARAFLVQLIFIQFPAIYIWRQ